MTKNNYIAGDTLRVPLGPHCSNGCEDPSDSPARRRRAPTTVNVDAASMRG